MRFATSLLLLFLAQAHASATPIEIFFEEDPTRAGWVKDIFVTDYKIPEELIGLKEVADCEKLQAKGKLDLCLNDNGDLLVVSVDSGFISESLKIFRAP